MTPFDNYEIRGCRHIAVPTETGVDVIAVQCPDSEANCWTLYGHIPGQGLETIRDFPTRKAADEAFQRITGIPFGSHEEIAARVRVMHAGPRLLAKAQAVAELRRRWRSQAEAETIDSIEYMDGLDELDLDAAIAEAEGRAV